MPTTREVDAARAERQRRTRRFYTTDRLGPQCADGKCHLKLDKDLADLGDTTHATCTTEARRLIKADRPYLTAPLTREDLVADTPVPVEVRRARHLQVVPTSPPDDVAESLPDDVLPCG